MKLTTLLCLTALAIGCKSKAERAPAEAKPTKHAPQPTSSIPKAIDVFTYANVAVSDAPLPARFTAELPTSWEALEKVESYPPGPLVSAAVCAGDAAMLAKVSRAVEAASKAGTLTGDLATSYASYFRFCDQHDHCDWLAGYVESNAPKDARRALWPGLQKCKGEGHRRAALGEDAPAKAVMDYYFDFGDPKPYHPRVASAAKEIVKTGSAFEIRQVGVVLAHYVSGDDGIKTLLAIHDSLTDKDKRAYLTLALGERTDERSKALFKAACAHPDARRDAFCQPHDPEIAKALERQDPTADELAACAAKPDPEQSWKQRGCLGDLAKLDRARAVALAAKISVPESEPYFELIVRTLREYPEEQALVAKLRDFQLLAPDSKPRATDYEFNALTAEDLLWLHGRASSFDVETGMFPNQHDELLAKLAALTDALDGVVFEEIAPKDDRGPYELRAYLKGKRYAVAAENNGDWYDVEAVLGLLNVLMRTRGSDVRFATLPTGDQTALVLVAPAAGMFAAAQAKLIRFEDAGAAMAAGKEFEDYVRSKLRP